MPANNIMGRAADAPSMAPAFHPTVWGGFFIDHRPQHMQKSEEWMKERAGKVKEAVNLLFDSCTDVVETMNLVDTLQRLAIDYHFQDQIVTALQSIHGAEFSSSNLHDVALRFRLLRQHGFWVSADEFNRFGDREGRFFPSITSDPKGLLSLYNAAHLLVHGETVLEEAIVFSRSRLESVRGSLKSPLAEQVTRSLHIPLPRTLKRIEALHYVREYGQDEAHESSSILELAKLDFNLLQILHLKELKAISQWWKELYENAELSYARDRVVECYFWAHTVYYEQEYSNARLILAKVFALLSVLDDTYDVHATLEESRMITEAMQRWDKSATPVLPEFIKKFYIKLIENFEEFEDGLEPNEKYRVDYNRKALQILSKYYLQESEWFHHNYMPTFKEQVDVTVMSSAIPNLCVGLLIGMGDVVIKEAFEWVMRCTDAVKACSEVTRFMNDFAAFKHGRNKRDVASTVECYINEHEVTGEVAFAKMESLIEDAWKATNQSLLEPPAAFPVVQRVVNLTISMPFMFSDHVDAYTYSKDLRETIQSLFVNPIPI